MTAAPLSLSFFFSLSLSARRYVKVIPLVNFILFFTYFAVLLDIKACFYLF